MVANCEAAAHTPNTTPAPPIVRREGPLATGEKFRPVALAGLTVLLLGLCAWLAYPFLPAIAWGVALAVIAWPLHAWINRRLTGHKTGSALLSSFVVAVAVVGPLVFVAYHIAREAGPVADQTRREQGAATVRDRMADAGLGGVVTWADGVGVDVDAEVQKAAGALTADALALARGSLAAVLQTAVAFFILFYLLRDRAELLGGLRRLLPMTRPEADRVFDSAAGSVQANLYASLVTSFIDGVTGGLMFWALGLPAPVLWGTVMFVLSLLPVAGIFLVWVPAAAYLGVTGNWGGAAALAAWGVACSILVDTLLYTRLAGDRMRLHQVPALIAFVGGIVLFGAAGIILGPGILAVTVAVLDVWHRRTEAAAGEEPAPAAT